MALYNELILVEMIGTAALRGANAMRNRKTIKTHQNILVFYKSGEMPKLKSVYRKIFVFYKGKISEIRNNYKQVVFDEGKMEWDL